MTQTSSLGSVTVALALFHTSIWWQTIVFPTQHPDPCAQKTDCVSLDDTWNITVEPTGQIYLGSEKMGLHELEKYAASWKDGTWPIVVRGQIGTKRAQITPILTMLRRVGVRTTISCEELRP